MNPIRILSIVWYKVLPARFGGQKGIAHFNQALGKLYPLVCLCSRNNEPAIDLSYTVLPELPVSKWQFLNPFIQQRIVRTAKKEKPTHIILEHPYHARAAIKACRVTRAKLIVHSHNIESERYRQLNKTGWRILYRHEKSIHQQADLSLFKTEDELKYAVEHFELSPGKCVVMPYGIEPPNKPDKAAARKILAARHGIAPETRIILFAGTLDYEPNAQAVNNIYAHLAPETSANQKIIICGRNKIKGFEHLNSLSHPHVINAGEVEDIANYFASADIFVNPVMAGGGVQTKNLEALAFDLNLVCFSTMLSGIDLSLCGGKLFPVQPGDWKDFLHQMDVAITTIPHPTPSSFFDYYSFTNQVLKLSGHL
jgi:glycosyltransferase involved in cell wall biosynthesis